MTVRELREVLKEARDTDEVVILSTTSFSDTWGCTQATKIKHIKQGFDWDSHKILIVPEVELVIMDLLER